MAEAYLGLVDTAQAQRQLELAYASAPDQWMKETTHSQIEKLTLLLEESPLKFIRA